MTDLPRRFSDRLDAHDTDALRTMAGAAEWAEEIDLRKEDGHHVPEPGTADHRRPCLCAPIRRLAHYISCGTRVRHFRSGVCLFGGSKVRWRETALVDPLNGRI